MSSTITTDTPSKEECDVVSIEHIDIDSLANIDTNSEQQTQTIMNIFSQLKEKMILSTSNLHDELIGEKQSRIVLQENIKDKEIELNQLSQRLNSITKPVIRPSPSLSSSRISNSPKLPPSSPTMGTQSSRAHKTVLSAGPSASPRAESTELSISTPVGLSHLRLEDSELASSSNNNLNMILGSAFLPASSSNPSFEVDALRKALIVSQEEVAALKRDLRSAQTSIDLLSSKNRDDALLKVRDLHEQEWAQVSALKLRLTSEINRVQEDSSVAASNRTQSQADMQRVTTLLNQIQQERSRIETMEAQWESENRYIQTVKEALKTWFDGDSEDGVNWRFVNTLGPQQQQPALVSSVSSLKNALNQLTDVNEATSTSNTELLARNALSLHFVMSHPAFPAYKHEAYRTLTSVTLRTEPVLSSQSTPSAGIAIDQPSMLLRKLPSSNSMSFNVSSPTSRPVCRLDTPTSRQPPSSPVSAPLRSPTTPSSPSLRYLAPTRASVARVEDVSSSIDPAVNSSAGRNLSRGRTRPSTPSRTYAPSTPTNSSNSFESVGTSATPLTRKMTPNKVRTTMTTKATATTPSEVSRSIRGISVSGNHMGRNTHAVVSTPIMHANTEETTVKTLPL